MTGRRILAIPGVLALVIATTIGVGILPAGAAKYTPPTLPSGRYCTHVNGFSRTARVARSFDEHYRDG